MTLHFLHDFPREIRDKIYTYVLASHTGCVSLLQTKTARTLYEIRPLDVRHNTVYNLEPIGLQILRTCQQIHAECEDLFWQLNAYGVKVPWNLAHDFTCFDMRVCRGVRRVEIGVMYPYGRDVLREVDRRKTEKALEALANWSRESKLKSVSLVLSRDSSEEFDKLMVLGRRSESNLGADVSFLGFLMLLVAAREKFPRAVERKVAFYTKWPRLSLEQRKTWTRVQASKEANIWVFTPLTFLKKVHEAWGGELWVDGLLCWKDQVEITLPFRLDSHNLS